MASSPDDGDVPPSKRCAVVAVTHCRKSLTKSCASRVTPRFSFSALVCGCSTCRPRRTLVASVTMLAADVFRHSASQPPLSSLCNPVERECTCIAANHSVRRSLRHSPQPSPPAGCFGARAHLRHLGDFIEQLRPRARHHEREARLAGQHVGPLGVHRGAVTLGKGISP
jgi:hypothetical protein